MQDKPTVTEAVKALASPEPPPLHTRWHIERSIPVAMIVGFIIQTIFFVWWMAALVFEVRDNSRRIQLMEEARVDNETRSRPLIERFYKLEQQVIINQAELMEMKRRIERNEEFRRSQEQQRLNELKAKQKTGSIEVPLVVQPAKDTP